MWWGERSIISEAAESGKVVSGNNSLEGYNVNIGIYSKEDIESMSSGNQYYPQINSAFSFHNPENILTWLKDNGINFE